MSEIVIADKMCNKAALFGHISNGDGILDLGNGKSIKFICLNDKFVTLQLLETGIGQAIKTQIWRKTIKIPVKTVKTKNIAEKISASDNIIQSNLF